MKKKLFGLLTALCVTSGISAYQHTIINKLGQEATIKVTVLWGGKESTSGPWRNTEIQTIPANGEYTFTFKGAPCLNYIAVKQKNGSWVKAKKEKAIQEEEVARGIASLGLGNLAMAAAIGCKNNTFKIYGTIENPNVISPEYRVYNQK